MNHAVTSPDEPYVSIADTPEVLVTFLERAGVALRHPIDDKKVRLVDFGTRVGE